MKSFSVICPVCGSLNRGVYLEETQGRVECCVCKKDFISAKWKCNAGLQQVCSSQLSVKEGGRYSRINRRKLVGIFKIYATNRHCM